MSNLFKAAGKRIRGSPFILVIWIVFLALFVVSLGLLFEAYTTSLLGYEMIRTRKANEWVVPLVAALPILGQIALSYVYLNDTAKRWAGGLAFILHLVDMYTDVLYKVSGNFSDGGFVITAIIESEVLFTLGGIMLVTFAAGVLLEITPLALTHMGGFGEMIEAALAALGLGSQGDEKEQKSGGGGSPSVASDPLAGIGGRRQ